jgi:hypothetical protein
MLWNLKKATMRFQQKGNLNRQKWIFLVKVVLRKFLVITFILSLQHSCQSHTFFNEVSC